MALVPVADRRHARLDAAHLGRTHRDEIAGEGGREPLRLRKAGGTVHRLDHHQHRSVAANALDQLLEIIVEQIAAKNDCKECPRFAEALPEREKECD